MDASGVAPIPAPAFTAVLDLLRKAFLLPPEQIGRVPEDDVEALLAGIRALRGGPEAWGRRAALFPRRSLTLLFPALLATEAPDLLDRIGRILEVRATCSLHALGWAWLQHRYTDPRMQEGFRRLREALQRRDKKSCPPIPPDDGGPIDATLPVRIHAALQASGEKWVDRWLAQNDLLPGTPLERDVLARHFSACSDEGFVENERAFARMLPGLGAEGGAAVLGHYLRDHRLGPRYRPLNAATLGALGSPDSGHAAWSKVSDPAKARFWKWLVFRTVEDHLAGNPRKFSLLVRYVPYMESVRVLGEGVLMMGFGSFYLVDDRSTPAKTYYYEKAVFELWLEQLAEEQRMAAEAAAEAGAAADAGAGTEVEAEAEGAGPMISAMPPDEETSARVPSLPFQLARRVVLESFRASAVLVDYKEVGLLYAKDFLDDALGIGRRGAVTEKGKSREPEAISANRLF